MDKERIFRIQTPPLDNYHILLHETLFHNANGYLGIRYDFEEGYPEDYNFIRSQYLNGFYDLVSVPQPERLYGLVQEKQIMLDVANTQTIMLLLEDEQFSMFTGTVLNSSLTLDMNKGITVRDVTWRSPKGKEVHIIITRMTSFAQLSLFTIEYIVEPLNFSGPVTFESGHDVNVENFFDPSDPRTADERIGGIVPEHCEIRDGASFITASASRSGLRVCSGVKTVLMQDWEREFSVSRSDATCRYFTNVTRCEQTRLIKYAVFCDSIRCGDCETRVRSELEKALSVPLQELYRRQEQYLSEYWQNCLIEIDGDEEADQALQYNLYQLLQSAGKDSHSSIAPKGLSGEGYEGHYFWDAEMYIQAFFTITNPNVSRRLIEYRYETLDEARDNARILGHAKGALYPWRTIMGKECSGYFPAGSAQYHINGDIAYAVISYYLATKDLDFIRKKGAEILLETARLWLDVGNYHEGTFHINAVTGPDEYTCIVNNNYYTNVLAQYHLRWAARLGKLLRDYPEWEKLRQRLRLEEGELESFARAADLMYLPYDESLGINPQDDSFLQKKKWPGKFPPAQGDPLLLRCHPLYLYRHQICKQADTVMAHFILEDAQPEEVMRNSFAYYEKITTHDSSLSRCIFSIMAARLGMEEKAVAYFGDAIKLDLKDQCRNTKDGIHTANMAGNYMAIVHGFAGFRLKEEGISFSPILPAGWTGYRFHIQYEGSRILVDIDGLNCVFRLKSGTPKTITVYGTQYLLENRLSIPRKASRRTNSTLKGASL